jgi:ABC-type multidrug transport system ATPase subunit
MRKKLGLCAAVLGSPDVLILDEPLNGLDVEMMRKLRRRIEAERSAGKAVLVSSHVMSFVERVSNRVGVMRLGKLVAEGTPNELRQQTGLLNEDFEDVFFQLAE